MPAIRNEVVRKLWGDHEPFNSSSDEDRVDMQGWASQNPLLTRAIDELKPAIVAEIGAWKGGSTITMAKRLRALSIDGVVIAIDTWLGSWEHWIQPEWFPSLRFENGYPTLFQTFRANIAKEELSDYVVPLPMDSTNAATLLQHKELRLDALHIDGGHDYQAVIGDLRMWWPLLRTGGVLIGDDYHPDARMWPGVCQAFHEFFKTDKLENFEGKCWIRKTPG
jgi:predicted O-methyltransferase YrrM